MASSIGRRSSLQKSASEIGATDGNPDFLVSVCAAQAIRTSIIISETRQENSELIGFIPAAVPDRFLNEFGSKFK